MIRIDCVCENFLKKVIDDETLFEVIANVGKHGTLHSHSVLVQVDTNPFIKSSLLLPVIEFLQKPFLTQKTPN